MKILTKGFILFMNKKSRNLVTAFDCV